jgi:hypothetical protein
MVAASEFFKFSNPLFLDAFVAVVLYIVCRILEKRLPRISEGIREASLVFIVFMFYDASRYFALDSEALAKANGVKVIKFEQAIHIDIELSLQKFALANIDLAKFLNSFYLGAHWGGLIIFFVWAYARVIFASPNKTDRRRKEYVRFRGTFILMNIIAACSFMAYPCAPPRVFPEYGFIDLLLVIGKTDVYASTRRWVNPYAAMPSMHQGYSLLFAITIVIMLRSEILALAVEPDEEEDEELGASKLDFDSNTTGLRAMFSQMRTRYEQYRVLSRATRSNRKKLFYISLLPFAFLLYPLFMFFVIVGTGNHFVLDALAGAAAMGIATFIYPFVLAMIQMLRFYVVQFGTLLLSNFSGYVMGTKPEIELGSVMEKNEEKKGFLEDSVADMA